MKTLKPEGIVDHLIEVAPEADAFVVAGKLPPKSQGESVVVALPSNDSVLATEVKKDSRLILRVGTQEDATKLQSAQADARKNVKP